MDRDELLLIEKCRHKATQRQAAGNPFVGGQLISLYYFPFSTKTILPITSSGLLLYV